MLVPTLATLVALITTVLGCLTRSCVSSWQILETCELPCRGPVALMPTELEVFDYNLDIHDSELESQEDNLRLQVGAVHSVV